MPHAQQAPFWVVATASSAGGMRALQSLLAELPADFPAAVLVVQHMMPGQRSLLAAILDRGCALPVHEAESGERIAPGRVYVAAPGRHLVLEPDLTLTLSHAAPEHHVRPSAEVLFASVARACGPRCAAVVLTGRDGDGSLRCSDVRTAGGTVIAQDPATAEYPWMPQSAIDTGCVSMVLSLAEIPAALQTLVAG